MVWFLFVVSAWSNPAHVTLPLDDWRALQSASDHTRPAPDLSARAGRTLVGRLERGLLTATLTDRFEVDGKANVPLVSGEVTLIGGRFDGGPAPLEKRDGTVVLQADAGRHTAEIDLVVGKRTDRFARAVDLQLAPGGPTAIDLWIGEHPIEATLGHGLITESRRDGEGTRIRGWLDATGRLDLTWKRELHQSASTDARIRAEAWTLFEAAEDAMTGVARYEVDVLRGEVDRFDLRLPEGVEVLDVTGDAVLQWQTDAGGTLAVLLRYLASDAFTADVRFQYPIAIDDEVPLNMPVPVTEGEVTGALAVQTPPTLAVSLAESHGATALSHRNVPQQLLGLSPDPLHVAMSFETLPTPTVDLRRQEEVVTSTTRVDDIQALTVVAHDGIEVSKMRMRVRNTSRQYLAVDLPPGAELTHCYRDGLPLQPAADRDVPGRILVPLSQSQRTAPGTPQQVVVAYGDTLTGLALKHYGDANKYLDISAANPGNGALRVGQTLSLPVEIDAPEARSFVLEIAWRTQGSALGSLGRRTVQLPELDIDVLAANWHVYLPEVVQPLTIRSTLPQRSRIRYGAAGNLWRLVMPTALAGEYRSVLSERRAIYKAKQQMAKGEESRAFPLIGDKYRFSGVLLTSAPEVTVHYLSASVATGVRWTLGFLAAGVALLIGLRPRWIGSRVLAVATLLPFLAAGNYVLGAHGMVLWGGFIGLGIAWVASGGWRMATNPNRSPWIRLAMVLVGVLSLVCLSALGPLLPLVGIGGLTIALWRQS